MRMIPDYLNFILIEHRELRPMFRWHSRPAESSAQLKHKSEVFDIFFKKNFQVTSRMIRNCHDVNLMPDTLQFYEKENMWKYIQ